MSIFIEYHLIQNFAPSNLNRDDTGSPKDAFFGGYRRARVSSQCFKRAVRLAARQCDLLPESNLGVRTLKLKDLLRQRLEHRGTDLPDGSSEVDGKIDAALSAAGLKIKDDGKTEYLLFLGNGEINALAKLIDTHWDALPVSADKKSKKESKTALPSEIVKQAKSLLDGGKAVDVALFGRMLADLPAVNQHAACQVAHAISTHKIDREFDYYTAVDDMNNEDETGAGMIGQIEFNSATFYRYGVLDGQKLLVNLQEDRGLTLAAVAAFTEAFVRAIPTGKQNSFAAHNAPDFIGICLRHGAPLNLANAFESPVRPSLNHSLTYQSVEALAGYEDKLADVYATPEDVWLILDLTDAWPQEKGRAHVSLPELVHAVRDLVAAKLEG